MQTPSSLVGPQAERSQARADGFPPPSRASWTTGPPPTLGRLVRTPGGTALQWELRRNCSLTPREAMSSFLLLCAMDASVATGFWVVGLPLIALFSALELSAFALALLHYGRHACDHEVVTLDPECLRIEVHCGTQVQRTEFRAAWVRVAPPTGVDALVGLSERGPEFRIGRYVRLESRTLLARELQQALATLRFGRPSLEPAP